jgi:streptogramin lyase
VIVAGGLTAVAGVILAVLLSRGGAKPTAVPSARRGSSSSPASVGAVTGALLRIDPATNEVAAHAYAVGVDPTAVAIGYASVWVANGGDNSILRLDPATGNAEATVVLDQEPRSIAIGSGVSGVWINTVDHVSKIDQVSNDLVLTQDLGDATGVVASGEESVWVTGLLFGLGKIDPTSGLFDPGFSVGQILCSACFEQPGGGWSGDHQRGAPPSVAAGFGSVWAVGAPPPSGPSAVWRVDPSRGTSAPIRVRFAALGVAVGKNAVWAVGTNGEVARIDPVGNRVLRRIETGSGATQVVAGLGSVWVLNPTLGTVIRIDPAKNTVVATIDVGKGASAVATGEGSVWVTRRAG